MRSLYLPMKIYSFCITLTPTTYATIDTTIKNKSILHHTIILQKRALRIIHNAKFNSHTDPLFRYSRTLKLHDIYEYQYVLFIFDFINGKLPASFNTVFTFKKDIPNARSTGQSHHKLPLSLYELPKMWNKWEKFIDQSGSRSMCKKTA